MFSFPVAILAQALRRRGCSIRLAAHVISMEHDGELTEELEELWREAEELPEAAIEQAIEVIEAIEAIEAIGAIDAAAKAAIEANPPLDPPPPPKEASVEQMRRAMWEAALGGDQEHQDSLIGDAHDVDVDRDPSAITYGPWYMILPPLVPVPTRYRIGKNFTKKVQVEELPDARRTVFHRDMPTKIVTPVPVELRNLGNPERIAVLWY